MKNKPLTIILGVIASIILLGLCLLIVWVVLNPVKSVNESQPNTMVPNIIEVTRIVEVTRAIEKPVEVTRIVESTVIVEKPIEVTQIIIATPQIPPISSGPQQSFGEGMWRVGQDIIPGTYKAIIPESIGCYWERLKGFSGSLDDIIANGSGDTGQQIIVTISPTDIGFNSHGCGTWQLVP